VKSRKGNGNGRWQLETAAIKRCSRLDSFGYSDHCKLDAKTTIKILKIYIRTSLFTSTVAINLAGQITQNDILKGTRYLCLGMHSGLRIPELTYRIDLKDFAATKVILDNGRQYSAVTRNGGFSM
jgi:hypothetical protein